MPDAFDEFQDNQFRSPIRQITQPLKPGHFYSMHFNKKLTGRSQELKAMASQSLDEEELKNYIKES